jgi:hypothetical protein
VGIGEGLGLGLGGGGVGLSDGDGDASIEKADRRSQSGRRTRTLGDVMRSAKG